MGGIGNQYFGALFALFAEIGGKHEHRRQLSLGTSGRLQRDGVHPGDGGQKLLQFIL